MKLFDLYATISLDGKSFMSGLKSASSSFGSFASTISTGVVKIESTVEASVKRIGVAMVGLGSTLAATGVKYNSMMENYTADFTTLLQDATKAQQKVEELRKLDLVSPLDMNTLAGATKTMLSFGVAEDEVGSKLTELTDISMGNAERMNSLALAYAQIRSVGKLTMIDLRQMANQGFNPLKVVAEKTGVALGDLQDFMSYGKPSELMQEAIKAANDEIERLGANASEGAKMLAQMGEEGEISADIVSRAITIATSEGGQYFKAAENAAKTLTGQLSMLKGGVSKLIGSGFEPMSEALTEDILPYMNQLIEDLDEAFNRHGGGNEGLVGMLAVVRDELVKMRDESGEYTKEAQHNIVQGAFLAKNTLKVFNGMLPTYIDIGEAVFDKLREGIEIALPELKESAKIIGPSLVAGLVDIKSDFLIVGLDIIAGIADGIAQDYSKEGEGKIHNAIMDAVGNFAEWVSTQENQDKIISGAQALLHSIYTAIQQNAGPILSGLGEILIRTIFGDEVYNTVAKWFGWDTVADEYSLKAQTMTPEEYRMHAVMSGEADSPMAAEIQRMAIINEHGGLSEYDIEIQRLEELQAAAEAIGDFVTAEKYMAQASILSELVNQGNFESITEAIKSAEEIANGGAAFDETTLDSWETFSGEVGEVNTYLEDLNNWLDTLNGKEATVFVTQETHGGGAVKGFATGLDYVPYDEYMARLHEGEAVLTKEEAKRWRRGEQDGGMMVVREEQSTRPIALYIDGQEVASVLYNQMNKRINNGNLQQIYGMGG